MSTVRFWLSYLWADARFKAQVWWIIATGRGRDDAPESLFTAYNRQVRIWNARQNRRSP